MTNLDIFQYNDSKIKKQLSLKTKKKVRFVELDLIKTILIILVLLYHFAFFITMLPMMYGNSFYEIDNSTITWLYRTCSHIAGTAMIRPYVTLFAGLFLITEGITTMISRNNFKRGVLFLGTSALITLVTVVIYRYFIQYLTPPSDIVIVFGIFGLVSTITLFYSLLQFIFGLFKKDVPIVLIFALFVICLFTGIVIDKVKKGGVVNLYYNYELSFYNVIKVCFGFEYFGADYFPIFPNASFIFFGMLIGRLVYQNRKEPLFKCLDNKPMRVLSFMGKHTLIFYITELPVLVGIFMLTMYCLGYNLDI